MLPQLYKLIMGKGYTGFVIFCGRYAGKGSVTFTDNIILQCEFVQLHDQAFHVLLHCMGYWLVVYGLAKY